MVMDNRVGPAEGAGKGTGLGGAGESRGENWTTVTEQQ